MESQVQSLLEDVQSPDNARRQFAEKSLADLFQQDPSQTALLFTSIAANAEFPLVMRQSCLLYLKKVVPIFWSAGFQSFTGPAIRADVKQQTRNVLLGLISSDLDSKIRNGAIYCVVQIAAVDYPDEWPDLLDNLFGGMLSSSGSAVSLLGGLQLLQDIFDDLITEELFFDRGVGITTIQHCLQILNSEEQIITAEIKTAAARLYSSCLNQFQNPDVIEDESKTHILKTHFLEVCDLLQKVLTVEITQNSYHDFQLRTTIYGIASSLISEFPEDLIPQDFGPKIHYLVINDLVQASQIYVNVAILQSNSDEETNEVNINEVLKNLLNELYGLLTSISVYCADSEISKSEHLNSALEYFGESILASAFIPIDIEFDYLTDFNIFVVDETGLSPDYTVRNAIFDYLTEINEFEFKQLNSWIWAKLISLTTETDEIDWRSKEAIFYLFKCISSSDHYGNVPLVEKDSNKILQTLNKLILNLEITTNAPILEEETGENLVKSRIIDIIPDYLNSFETVINVKEIGIAAFKEVLKFIKSSKSNLLKVSILNSITPYDSILDFKSIASSDLELGSSLYDDIFTIISQIMEESTDDTPSLLSSALTRAFKLHEHTIEDLNLLIAIVSKDPSNIQLILEVEEALESLFEGISNIKFNQYLESLLPQIISTIESEGLAKNGEFSTSLNLSLQILNIFIHSLPHASSEDQYEPISQDQFNLIFERVSLLISVSLDDQILQISGEIYNSLLLKIAHTNWFNLEQILKVLSKFFNPELSDSAIMNVGSLVVSILSRFNSTSSTHAISNEVLAEILEATSKRLLVTENISTIENFLNVLCFMISINVEQTLVFLNEFQILQQILNIWFKNFDILKGHERIKLNCESLMKIYFFIGQVEGQTTNNKEFLEIVKNLKVDGDELLNNFDKGIIITRSMKKKLNFEQIPVFFKIAKLLVNELNSQVTGNPDDAVHEEDLDEINDDHDYDHDHDHDHHGEDDDAVVEDDDAWEDLDDIGDDYEKLKSYIDIDNTSDNKSSGLKNLLISFFKITASQNVLNFQEIYENYLTDQERKVLTDNIM